jgi:hypothetical protein
LRFLYEASATGAFPVQHHRLAIFIFSTALMPAIVAAAKLGADLVAGKRRRRLGSVIGNLVRAAQVVNAAWRGQLPVD